MTIGQRIKMRRESLGLTQDELAKKVGYASRSSINKIELSRDLPLRKVEKMAVALETSPSFLMGWTTNPDPNYVPTPEEEANEIVKGILAVDKVFEDILGDKKPKVSTSGKVYYFDDEAAEMAQELFENEGERILMSASRGLKKEDMIALAEIAKRMRGTNIDG